MSIQHFMAFDGVEGEIRLSSWTWGLSAPPAGGKPRPDEVTLTHAYDRASPILAKLAATGARIKTATLTARDPESKQVAVAATLSDVKVTSVRVSAHESDILEAVSVSYEKIAFTHASATFEWDVSKNT